MADGDYRRVAEPLKRKWDAEKESRCGHPHAYTYDEWRPWTGNNYIKSHYEVKLEDGTILTDFRPNAGKLVAYRCDREFSAEDNVMVRLSKTSPW